MKIWLLEQSGNYSQFTPVGVSCAKELTAHYSNLRGRLVDLLCTNDAESQWSLEFDDFILGLELSLV